MGSRFLASIGWMFFKLLGWRCTGTTPAYPKYVILAAPHTSNWDAFYLLCAAAILRLRFSYFGKDTLFRGPLGWVMRATGGLPLDRSRNQGLVAQAVKWFKGSDTFAMGLAPEGTRRYAPGWKSGFYYIALEAGIPIVLGYIDYARKEGGILPEVLMPTGDIDRDFEFLRQRYAPLTAKHEAWRAPVTPLGPDRAGHQEARTGGSAT